MNPIIEKLFKKLPEELINYIFMMIGIHPDANRSVSQRQI